MPQLDHVYEVRPEHSTRSVRGTSGHVQTRKSDKLAQALTAREFVLHRR